MLDKWRREVKTAAMLINMYLSAFDVFYLFLTLFQVAEVRSQAEEAKGKAQAALDKATATKNKVERSNNDLRDLIKQIRDFLTRESDILLGSYIVHRGLPKQCWILLLPFQPWHYSCLPTRGGCRPRQHWGSGEPCVGALHSCFSPPDPTSCWWNQGTGAQSIQRRRHSGANKGQCPQGRATAVGCQEGKVVEMESELLI